MKLGATVFNFSPLYTVPELAAQIEDSGTRVLFTISASALLLNALEVMELTRLERLVVGSVAGALPPAKSLLYRLLKRSEIAERPVGGRVTAFSALIANDGRCGIPPSDAPDIAPPQYTGRTPRTPKGAQLTQHTL